MATSYDGYRLSEQLYQQLGGCKYIVDVNSDRLNQDPFLKDFLAFKIDIAQGYIEELQIWERLGDQRKSRSAIDNAISFLEQIQVLIDRILDDQCEEAWVDFQRELRFSSYVSTPYEYVLTQTAKRLPIVA